MEGGGGRKEGGAAILVPLDGSPKSEWALSLGLWLARRSGGRLRIVAVEQPYPVSYRELLLERSLWARRYLAETKARIEATGFRDVETAPLAGEVVPALEGEAERVQPELVVMATHGRGALSRLWLGSVTDAFMRRSRWPVLVVRPAGDEGPSRLDAEPRLGRFLLTLDGSPTSEGALEPVLRLREIAGADLTLLRVVQFPPEEPPPFHRGPGPIDPVILDKLQGEAREYLAGLATELGGRGVPVTPLVRVAEHAPEAILEASRELPVDLIAMGTQGRGAIGRFVLGSVADKVVRSATVPVLLVRHWSSEPARPATAPARSGGRRPGPD